MGLQWAVLQLLIDCIKVCRLFPLEQTLCNTSWHSHEIGQVNKDVCELNV